MLDPLRPDAVLAFAPRWHMERVDAATICLMGENEHRVISDARTAALAVLIDGQRTVRQLVEAGRPHVSELEALYVLGVLIERGHVVPVNRAAPSELVAFWNGCGLDATSVLDALERTPVSVRGIGDPCLAECLRASLESVGVRVSTCPASVPVVVTDDYLNPELEIMAGELLRNDLRWFLMQPTGIRPLVGPYFNPGQGPCWKCMAFYMRNNRPVEECVRRHRRPEERVIPPRVSCDASLRTASQLSALALARALVGSAGGKSPDLTSSLLALDLSSLNIERHFVVRRPQCPACGDAKLMATSAESPIVLRPIEKVAFEDGGHRSQTPRQAFSQYQHLVSPLTGAVTYLGPVPARDTELRAVYASGYLVCPRDGAWDTHQFDKGCFGKGRSADQARMSAMGEAIERFSGVFQGDEAKVRASTEELGAQALPLDGLLNFSEEQYRTREIAQGRPQQSWPSVPEPLNRTTVIDWALGWSLSANERRYVPFPYCYAEAPPESGTAFCRPCGNGVAAGTCLEEAILQGLLELVERDAVGIWWYNRIARPAFDLASFNDSYMQSMRSEYQRLGWRIWVLDVTHDLRIPVCVALAHHEQEDRFSIGFGCHLQARLAIHRALTELNQLTEMKGTRKTPWAAMPPRWQDFLLEGADRVAGNLAEPAQTGNLRDDIQTCLDRLGQVGLQVVVVNKTRPDLGLSVAQVVVPGLRHFWPRFGPGRLYSVPCTLGWRSAPLSENQLNPVPLLL